MGDAEGANSTAAHESAAALPFEEALRSLPTPLLIIETATGRTVFANDAAVTAGLSQLEFESAASRILPKSDGASPAAGLASLAPDTSPLARAACGDTFEAERLVWNRPGGGVRTFIVCARRIPDGGRSLAAVSFIDVSTQVAKEAELRQTLQARDEFVSVATHELKEPLNSMLLALQLLRVTAGKRQDDPPADLTEDLDLMERQGMRLARQVANLLDASRIGHGKLRLDPETLDLCELVGEVVESFRPDALAAGIPLTLEATGPVVGSFDPVRMEQVVANLLSNAIKYGDGKPVRVRVRGGPCGAVLEVEDGGIGVPERDHRRVFEPFERAAPNHRRNSLGLGLHIVRTFVEAHGGSVRLRSDVGKGSTFTVELPCQPHAPGTDGDGAVAGDGDGFVPSPGAPRED